MNETQGNEGELRAISDWLIGRALGDVRIDDLFTGFCQRLADAGLPLQRGHLAVRTVHPMFSSVTVTWWRDGEANLERFDPISGSGAQWQQSPLFAMLQERVRETRHKLETSGKWSRFPLLVDWREKGMTEYFALLTPFGSEATAHERQDGMLCSWLTDRPGGFSDGDIAALRRLQTRLGVAVKVAKREQTAANVAAAYLGADAGSRVLAGQIHRGDGEFIHAVLWCCDLRGSTELADRMSAEDFLALLDSYFECTAGAVVENSGEVLSFIGDSVLAMFPIKGSLRATQAAQAALAATRDAEGRMVSVNRERSARGETPLRYGVGLHIGRVLFGNIGIPERIEFTVIGGGGQ